MSAEWTLKPAESGQVALPAWVTGTASHTWSPRLGGVHWHHSQADIQGVAEISLSELDRPVLVGLKSDCTDFGYRFDLDTFDANADTTSWWGDPADAEDEIQVWEDHGNAEFIWNIPCPKTRAASGQGEGYVYDASGNPQLIGEYWQQANYYGAYVQYMIGAVTMTPEQYNALNSTYNCFTDTECTTWNTTSETAVGGNWANLRAKRGHPDPYVIVAVIIGNEPYYTEDYETPGAQGDGEGYGIRAEAYKDAIRARGGNCATIPLGLHVRDAGVPSDASRTWFYPMMDNCTPADFEYIDLNHYYEFGTAEEYWKRTYPVGYSSGGFQEWWVEEQDWKADYHKYLWLWEDVKVALTEWGETASRWKLGCSEHGLQVTSQFAYNDMMAAIHWACWLSEMARLNSVWDSQWVFGDTGFSHALFQTRDGHITRTPGFYVMQMVMKLYGMEYLSNTNEDYDFPLCGGSSVLSSTSDYPYVVVRVFRDTSNGHVHLFIINQHASSSYDITGFQTATLVKWDQLAGSAFTDMNPIGDHHNATQCHAQGVAWHAEVIKTVDVTAGHTPGQPFTIPAISVNHIEVS